MMGRKFTDDEIVKALDICDKLNFFYGQRAGYELWFVKPVEVQDRDVKQFAEDMQFVKSVINRQKAEIDRLNKEVDRLSQCVLYNEGDIIDAIKAIRFVKLYPCAICSYEKSKTHECRAGVKYKGTCKVYKELQARLCGVKEMEDNP